MTWVSYGEEGAQLSPENLKSLLISFLDAIGPRRKVLVIPPDYSRIHSAAGTITEIIWEYYGDRIADILPALGTHLPMTSREISAMFGKTPESLFRVHNWRKDVVTLGEVPAGYIRQVSEDKVSFTWPAQVNRMLTNPEYDLILSVGQVVPHEVIGMANHNKNIFVGTGGQEGIHKSHFLGAAYGMERIMGRAVNPVRQVLNYAAEHFTAHLPLVYIQTVIGKSASGNTGINGLFIGDDTQCFEKAAALSLKLNFQQVEIPLKKVVVYLDPEEFKSTWLGNKSIYRTRMAIADNGELIVLAPGVHIFGEDYAIDQLIRKYGYRTTPEILAIVGQNGDLASNLAAAAHLIHGSSENRFRITYCPGHLSRSETEGVNFNYDDITMMMKKYDPEKLNDGYNIVDGEQIFFVRNPALGLWAHASRLNQE